MERIRNLDRYQKIVLILLSVMLVLFTAIYIIVSSRVGFVYRDAILPPYEENGNTVYAGRVNGKSARFVVTQDKTVTFHYGNKTYGPYTAHEDSTAVPEDSRMAEYMTGVEIREGADVFFRGGVMPKWEKNGDFTVYDEEGGLANTGVFVASTHGIMYDSEGNVVDQMAPNAYTILRLMSGPALTSKGEWVAWFGAVFVSVMIAVSILYADELFRSSLALMARNVDRAEPSDWEITRRYIGWTASTVMVPILYIMGLTT